MEDLYLRWPDMFRNMLESWGSVGLDIGPRSIVFCGMGGSGVVGDYISMLAFHKSDYPPVIVIKDYELPLFVSKEDLVFIVSYSGNTIETISCFNKALKRGSKIVVIASNGLLIEKAVEMNIPLIKVSENLLPRAALPEMLTAVLGVLDSSGLTLVQRNDIEKLVMFLRDNMSNIVENAKIIAEDLYDRIPVIVVPNKYWGLGWRLKNEFNENSKVPVKVEIMPEWGHNDIVGWERNGRYPWGVLIIHDMDDEALELLMNFAENYYKQLGLPTKILRLQGENYLQKLIYGTIVGGLSSVYLAKMYKIDPSITKSISLYKNAVRKLFDLLMKS